MPFFWAILYSSPLTQQNVMETTESQVWVENWDRIWPKKTLLCVQTPEDKDDLLSLCVVLLVFHCLQMNSWDPKRIDDPDFERRLDGFTNAGEMLSTSSVPSVVLAHVYTSLYTVHNVSVVCVCGWRKHSSCIFSKVSLCQGLLFCALQLAILCHYLHKKCVFVFILSMMLWLCPFGVPYLQSEDIALRDGACTYLHQLVKKLAKALEGMWRSCS